MNDKSEFKMYQSACARAMYGVASPEAFMKYVEELEDYARHSPGCLADYGNYTCECGLTGLLEDLKAARKASRELKQ